MGRHLHYFFAGGGTGGHIYPALAVAEQIKATDPSAEITFFCSRRKLDSQILSKTGLDFVPLPAKGFSAKPGRLISFCTSFLKSYQLAKKALKPKAGRAVVIGTGGFVSAAVLAAAGRLRIPTALLNVDIVPGKANKILSRFASRIFVQFDDTVKHFAGTKACVTVTGCPLRAGFAKPDKNKAISELGLDANKKTLLITGASSGSVSINSAVCVLLGELAEFSDDWQIVHLTGWSNYSRVAEGYENAKIYYKLLLYHEDMANLYATADLVVGRAGAVSIAEYAAAGLPAVCMPYPFHKDRHQYLNAAKLAAAGAAVIVDDIASDSKQTAQNLGKQLFGLMKDNEKLGDMSHAAMTLANTDAAKIIAENLAVMAQS